MPGPDFSRWLIVVPARLGSTRLPEKPLQDLAGKPLIVRVYENLLPLLTKGVSIIVATDSDKVVRACQKHQAKMQVQMTNPDHVSGTDRCWEVAQTNKADFVLNVQGDEPFIPLSDLEKLMFSTEKNSTADLGTLAFRSEAQEDFNNPNVVKVVRAQNGFGLYFTRAAAPSTRGLDPKDFNFWHHIGVYAFRRETLQKFCKLKPSPLEQREKLEQLRALENSMRILVEQASAKSLGIDTPEDLEDARAQF